MKVNVIARGRRRKWLEALAGSMLKQLKLTRFTEELLVVEAPEEGDDGRTVVLDDGGFLITLRTGQNNAEIGASLAHELVHVQQLASGLLKRTRCGWTWAGRKYRKSTPYLDCPWEQAAFSKQELLFRRAMEEVYS